MPVSLKIFNSYTEWIIGAESQDPRVLPVPIWPLTLRGVSSLTPRYPPSATPDCYSLAEALSASHTLSTPSGASPFASTEEFSLEMSEVMGKLLVLLEVKDHRDC